MTDLAASAVLQDLLRQWLPRQRWFPGRGGITGELAIVSDVTLLAGDPQLRHLIIDVPQASGPARFQVPLGCRTELPQAIAGSVIGTLPGLVVYDALHDPELAAVLLQGIIDERQEGPLRFAREPGALLGDFGPGRPLKAEQSNTSLVFGDVAILKLLRRLFPGANPDLEIADALARSGSARVAAPFGWIETTLDGDSVLLAVLSEFLANAREGWTLALEARAGGASFADEARELGLATAQMHNDMAAAFGSRAMTDNELDGLVSALGSKLDQAVTALPELGAYATRIKTAYDDLARMRRPITVQRIHGDYHLGQVMRSTHGWVALDFEGEPAAPLAERRALAPALRDVAGMLRSFDYAARHQLVGEPDRHDLAASAAADSWAQQCQNAFRAGYSAGTGADPADQATLLRALTLEKAVYEVIYEYRHRPAWMSIPLGYVAAA